MAADFQSVFWGTKHALALASTEAFSRHGVHAGQQFVLRCLWAEDGLSPGELARRLGLATPTVTRAAARMQAAGLLTRLPHPADRRLVRLVLTDDGRRLEKVIDREMHRLEQRALAGLSSAERTRLIHTLAKVRANLIAEQPPAR